MSCLLKEIVCKRWHFNSIREKLLGTCKTTGHHATMRMPVNIHGLLSMYKAPLQILDINIDV